MLDEVIQSRRIGDYILKVYENEDFEIEQISRDFEIVKVGNGILKGHELLENLAK